MQLEVETVGPALRESAAEYVQIVSTKLAKAEHAISTRRAVQLTRNIVAVAAALRVQDPALPFDDSACEDAFYTALRHSLPDAAWGDPISQTTLLSAHRAAWQLARADPTQDMRAILLETDPVRRIALTLTSALAGSDAGRVIVDAFSSLTPVARIATAAVLGPIVARRKDLPVATIEPIASEFARLAERKSERVTVRNGGADWRRQILSNYLGGLDRATTRGKMLANGGNRLDAAGRAIRDGGARGRLRPRAIDAAQRRRQQGRCGMSELHNMSVPPRTVLTVRREQLRGRRYRVDLWKFTGERSTRNTDRIAGTIRTDGGMYLLNLIERRAGRKAAVRPRADVHTRLKTLCDAELQHLQLPDSLGFFVDETDAPDDVSVPPAAAIAILAARSGPLYLPNRFEPSLITIAPVTLFFPDGAGDSTASEGGER